MKAIETHGIVNREGRLILKDQIPLPPSSVRVIVLAPDDDDMNEQDWLRSAASNEAFQFLTDPAEDIYKPSDGKPLDDAG